MTRRAGRPRALDDVKRREICALVSAGCGVDGAAKYVGCVASTIRREAKRNPQFCDDLRRASLNAELSPLQYLREAAKKYWRAAAWLLEHTNPQRYGKQNVRLLKPEEFGQYVGMMADIVSEEARDPDTIRRIVGRLHELQKVVERESWAKLSPIPKKSSRGRKRSRAAPAPPPTIAREPENHAPNA
ncbi:MAG: helix-turn-helix domain-containing protein [Pirellulales bacterium]